jgi:hypothetical protein
LRQVGLTKALNESSEKCPFDFSKYTAPNTLDTTRIFTLDSKDLGAQAESLKQ